MLRRRSPAGRMMDNATPSGTKRFRRKTVFLNPLFIVQLGVIALLCILIVYPALVVLDTSVRNRSGALSLVWFETAWSNPRYFAAVWNTIKIAACVSFFSTVAGVALAWAVTRTNMPGRRIFGIATVIPFIASSFIGAMAWVLLGSPEAGLLNQLWRSFGGSGPLMNIYSIQGVIFVQALYDMPFVYLLVAGALQSMDSSLEEASASAGASLFRTTFMVTLPLVLPAIVASSLLVFVLAAEQYGVPAVLGIPARIHVLTTTITELQGRYPPNVGLGAALSTILLALATGALWLQRRILKDRSYTTVGGKGGRVRRIDLRGLRWPLFGVCSLFVLLTILLPFGALFLSSIRTIWTADFRWEQFTIEHYRWVLFEYPITQRAMVNSILLAVAAATIGMLLSAVISFLSLRTRLPGRRVLQYLAVLPMGFPGVVLAFAFLQVWINPPLVLYGTIWIMLLAYIVLFLPVGVRSTSATIVQIHPELEEASLSSGANWLQTLRHITLPLLKPGLVAGWALLFVLSLRELSSSILLYSPQREVISVAIYDLQIGGQFRALSALAIMQTLMALAMLALINWVTRENRQSARLPNAG